METKSWDSLGLTWNLNVPTTVEEYDSMAKKPGACLAAATAHVVFHSTLGDIRAAFASVLERELTERNLARKANGEEPFDISWDSGKKNPEGEVIDLNEAAWVNKVLAVTGTKIGDWAFLQTKVLSGYSYSSVNPDGTTITTTVPGVNFDPSASERKAGPPKLSKASLNAADALIANTKIGPTGLIKLAKILETNNPTELKKQELNEDGTPKREYLARLVSAEEARKRAIAQAKLAEDYAALAT